MCEKMLNRTLILLDLWSSASLMSTSFLKSLNLECQQELLVRKKILNPKYCLFSRNYVPLAQNSANADSSRSHAIL